MYVKNLFKLIDKSMIFVLNADTWLNLRFLGAGWILISLSCSLMYRKKYICEELL